MLREPRITLLSQVSVPLFLRGDAQPEHWLVIRAEVCNQAELATHRGMICELVYSVYPLRVGTCCMIQVLMHCRGRHSGAANNGQR